MLRFLLEEQKKLKNIIQLLLIFIALLSLYTFLDNYGFQTYEILGDAFGQNVVIATIALNVLISLGSAFMVSITIINFRLNNQVKGGTFFATIGNAFAVIFTGCASCGLSLVGALGISIGLPVVTPGAVKYKFFAFLLIILGNIVIGFLINNSTCKIKERRN